MRNTRIFGLVLFVVFAFSAVVAAMVSAETTLVAQWLVGGIAVLAELLVEAPGELLLEDTKTIVGKLAILCSGILVGTIGPEGEGLVIEELSLSLQAINPLEGTGLLCSAVTGCEPGSEASSIEDWPEGLPWHTLLVLMENGKILGLIEGGETDILCLVLGVMVEDLCAAQQLAPTSGEVVNEPTAEILAGEIGLPLTTCVEGGAESGVVQTDVLSSFELVEAGELTVSSE